MNSSRLEGKHQCRSTKSLKTLNLKLANIKGSKSIFIEAQKRASLPQTSNTTSNYGKWILHALALESICCQKLHPLHTLHLLHMLIIIQSDSNKQHFDMSVSTYSKEKKNVFCILDS